MSGATLKLLLALGALNFILVLAGLWKVAELLVSAI